MHIRLSVAVFLIALLAFSCRDNSNKFVVDDASLPDIEVDVMRYGKALFELDVDELSSGLKQIKPDFALFLDADLDDSANIKQIKSFVGDTALIRIYKKTTELFPDNDYLNSRLTSLFRYMEYYFPNIKTPKVYTYVSGMQYENPIWIRDSILIIALDVYLGPGFEPYSGLGLPRYKISCMRPENLAVDVAKQYYNQYLTQKTPQKTLLDRMLAAGKLMYFLDMLLPETPDSIKFCFTADQLKWTEENEKNIWAFMIENDLLFSNDYRSQQKLMMDGPFTTGFSKRSPARLGVWMGRQIIGDFMDNNPEISINELIRFKDSQKLLRDSGYKP
ncbi:MAG: hypothetical protein GXO88_00085 [Chlorobi bacterium]|nr:hypothetical protein [Chlorobiota bacterium]